MSIRNAGAMPGVVLNPSTPVGAVEDTVVRRLCPRYVSQSWFRRTEIYCRISGKYVVSDRLLMSVADPFGSKLMAGSTELILKQWSRLVPEIIVAGSAIFGTSDPEVAVNELRDATVQV